jgi:hypothetical protein
LVLFVLVLVLLLVLEQPESILFDRLSRKLEPRVLGSECRADQQDALAMVRDRNESILLSWLLDDLQSRQYTFYDASGTYKILRKSLSILVLRG